MGKVVEMVDHAITEMFPDWESLEKGQWSEHEKVIVTAEPDTVEIGLYREDDEEMM